MPPIVNRYLIVCPMCNTELLTMPAIESPSGKNITVDRTSLTLLAASYMSHYVSKHIDVMVEANKCKTTDDLLAYLLSQQSPESLALKREMGFVVPE